MKDKNLKWFPYHLFNQENMLEINKGNYYEKILRILGGGKVTFQIENLRFRKQYAECIFLYEKPINV